MNQLSYFTSVNRRAFARKFFEFLGETSAKLFALFYSVGSGLASPFESSSGTLVKRIVWILLYFCSTGIVRVSGQFLVKQKKQERSVEREAIPSCFLGRIVGSGRWHLYLSAVDTCGVGGTKTRLLSSSSLAILTAILLSVLVARKQEFVDVVAVVVVVVSVGPAPQVKQSCFESCGGYLMA